MNKQRRLGLRAGGNSEGRTSKVDFKNSTNSPFAAPWHRPTLYKTSITIYYNIKIIFILILARCERARRPREGENRKGRSSARTTNQQIAKETVETEESRTHVRFCRFWPCPHSPRRTTNRAPTTTITNMSNMSMRSSRMRSSLEVDNRLRPKG